MNIYPRRLFRCCLYMLIIAAGIMFLNGCSKPDLQSRSATVEGGQLTIVTSFYPIYISTINITRDVPNVKVYNLTKPQTGCLHDYQLSPDDVKILAGAQIFVINGAGMESFMDKVIKQQPDLQIIEASKDIPLIKGPGETEDNPHVWVSVAGAIAQVKNIGQQLAILDPQHASQYQHNTAVYTAKLEELRQQMHQELDGAKNRKVVTFHEAFPYFAREFNLQIAAVVEREPGSEPSAAELAETIELIKETKIKTIFTEPQYSSRAAQAIARETGAKVFTLDPGVTGPSNADAYISIMKTNLQTLKEALR